MNEIFKCFSDIDDDILYMMIKKEEKYHKRKKAGRMFKIFGITTAASLAAAACLAFSLGIDKFFDFGKKVEPPVLIDTDNHAGNAVPNLLEVLGMTESKALSALSKYSYDDIVKAWGEPLSGGSGGLGGIWKADGMDIYISFYENDRTVKSVQINEIAPDTLYTEDTDETNENELNTILEKIASPAFEFYGHYTGGDWSYGNEIYILDGEDTEIKCANLAEDYHFHTEDELFDYLGNFYTEEAAAQFTPAEAEISGDRITSRYSSMLRSVDGKLYAAVSGKCGYLKPDISKAAEIERSENEIVFSLELFYPAENGFMPRGTYNFIGTLHRENGEWKLANSNIAVLEENELYDIMQFCRLPYYADLVRMSEDEVKYILAGYTYDDIKTAWGEPAEYAGENGGVWRFDGSELTLVFDETGKNIESVKNAQSDKEEARDNEIDFSDEQLRVLLGEIYEPARDFYSWNWKNYDKTYTLKGEGYTPYYTELTDDFYFSTVDGMLEFLTHYFKADVVDEIMSSVESGEIIDEKIVCGGSPTFINVGGQIYAKVSGKGGMLDPDLNTAKVVSATENKIEFSVELIYDLDDGYLDKGIYRFYGTLANEEGKWKFADKRIITADLNNPYSLS